MSDDLRRMTGAAMTEAEAAQLMRRATGAATSPNEQGALGSMIDALRKGIGRPQMPGARLNPDMTREEANAAMDAERRRQKY